MSLVNSFSFDRESVPIRALHYRIMKDSYLTSDEATTLVDQYVKFMTLVAGSNKKGEATSLLRPSPLVLLAWRTHILYSQFYKQFCFQQFGAYVHLPSSLLLLVHDLQDPNILTQVLKEYEHTITSMQAAFGDSLPEACWPAKERFLLDTTTTFFVSPSKQRTVVQFLKTLSSDEALLRLTPEALVSKISKLRTNLSLANEDLTLMVRK